MICNLLDLRCIIVNELIGNVLLSVVLGAVVYFMIASRMKFGFDTTIAFSIPLLLILGLAISSFSVIYAFVTVIVGFMLAFLFNQIVGNR